MYYKDKSCILHNIYEPCLRVGWMEFVITAWVRTSCPHSGMATPSFLCKSWECESQMWRVSVMSKGFWWLDLVHWFLFIVSDEGIPRCVLQFPIFLLLPVLCSLI